jgi:shikimate dehydrogenase
MISLALLGKDILHSKSKEIYEELLAQKIDYKIYDCPSPLEIPTLAEIFKSRLGLSITSPYKRFYLDQVEISGPNLNAINCIKKSGDKFLATNTDYLAIEEIVEDFSLKFKTLFFVILGDGVMSEITQNLLKIKCHPYQVFSRKLNSDFIGLDIPDKIGPAHGQVIVVNTCSREFIFSGKLSPDYLFWDYNYNFLPHPEELPSKTLQYIDGLSMLRLQAKYAINFWDL